MLIKVNRFSLRAEKKKSVFTFHSPPYSVVNWQAQGNTFITDLVGFGCARILGVLPHFSFAVQSPQDPVASLTSNCPCLKATFLTGKVGPCFGDGLIGNKIWSQEKTWTVQASVFWGWISADVGFDLGSEVLSTSLWYLEVALSQIRVIIIKLHSLMAEPHFKSLW